MSDSQSGTPVQLVIPRGAPPGNPSVVPPAVTPPGTPSHPSHLPFTGFELVPLLLLASLLLAVGILLARAGRLPSPFTTSRRT